MAFSLSSVVVVVFKAGEEKIGSEVLPAAFFDVNALVLSVFFFVLSVFEPVIAFLTALNSDGAMVFAWYICMDLMLKCALAVVLV